MTLQLFTSFIFIAGSCAFASVDEGPIGFKIWKDTQFVEAKNKVARLSNQLTIIKRQQKQDSAEVITENSDADPESLDMGAQVDDVNHSLQADQTEKVLKSKERSSFEEKQVAQIQADLKVALENLQFVAELSLEDYFAVYLSRFGDDPEAIQKVAKDLSQDEVTQLLKLMLKKNLDEALKIQTMRVPDQNRGTSDSL